MSSSAKKNLVISTEIGLAVLMSVLLVGCGDSTTGLSDGTTAESDVYELELDSEVGPLDDGNSASEPFFTIPGDYEVDSDGVEVDVPELGAALPAVPIRATEGAWSRVFNWPVSPRWSVL